MEPRSTKSCLQITAGGVWPGTTPTTPITPAGKGLKVAVSDNHDPIGIDRKLTYTITVTNESFQPDRNLVLTVTVPPQMSPRKTGNTGPGNLDAQVIGQEIVFDRLAEIRGGGASVEYRVVVDTRRAGVGVLRVKLSGNNSAFPVTDQEETTVQGQ